MKYKVGDIIFDIESKPDNRQIGIIIKINRTSETLFIFFNNEEQYELHTLAFIERNYRIMT
jgi:hypothetical protein